MTEIGNTCSHSAQSHRALSDQEQDLVPSARFFCDDCFAYITMRGPNIHYKVVALPDDILCRTPSPTQPRSKTEVEKLDSLIETHFLLLDQLMPVGPFERPPGVERAASVVRSNLNNALHEWHGLTGKPHRLEMVPDPEPIRDAMSQEDRDRLARETEAKLPLPVYRLAEAVKAREEAKFATEPEQREAARFLTDLKTTNNAAVVHPAHYNAGKFEVWDVVQDWHLDFLLGNVVKYVARADHKGNQLEDLKKAQQYLNKKIAEVEAAQPVKWSAELCHVRQEDNALPLVWVVREEGSPERRVYCDWIDDAHSGPRIDEAKAIRFAQRMAPDKKVLEIHGRPT